MGFINLRVSNLNHVCVVEWVSKMFEFLGLSYEALKSNFVSLGKPYKLNFAITMRCQSRCLTCNIWELKPKDELSVDEICEFSRKNRTFRWIGLTGGEPFLRSDIVEIAQTFKENSKGLYLLTIPTNSLCNVEKQAEKIREMLELKVPRVVITISLDGGKETHDRIRGVPGNFERAIAMFKHLREMGTEYPNLSVVFGYTISSANQGQFSNTFSDVSKEVPSISYDSFHMNLAQISDNYYRNNGSGILADRAAAAAELAEVSRNRKTALSPMAEIESRFLKGLVEFARSGNPPEKCRSLEASLFMDSWGNVFPSIMWNRKIANVREIGYDLSKVWNGSDAADVREKIRNGEDPKHWTSCEAYQSVIGSLIKRHPYPSSMPVNTAILRPEPESRT